MTEKAITARPTPPQRTPRDSWSQLTALTDARIALGRVGSSMPTDEVLRFSLAHAKARDAVHARFEAEALAGEAAALALDVHQVRSAAADRQVYLRRPDLGRMLQEADRGRLLAHRRDTVIAFVIADGLSATAIHANAVPFLSALLPLLRNAGFQAGPAVIAHHARVALGDDVGAALTARLVVMLIGERPGLSAADSMGVYLTYAPRPGRTDAERNCISNIRSAGLVPQLAAKKAFWLIREALRQEISGVHLKDNAAEVLADGHPDER